MSAKTLKEYLDSKKCFKIVCGAGNEDFFEITKLCALYAKAGCRFFDVNASVEAVRAAKKGIKFAGLENECYICVSVGTKDDPHLSKYSVIPEKCSYCGICQNVCLQNAVIKEGGRYYVKEDRCIGCGKCYSACPNKAFQKHNKEISFETILPPIIKEGIDCIEYHIITDDESEIIRGWNIITSLFDGVLSVCLDHSKLSGERINAILKAMKDSCDNLFVVQADGAPMSGGNDDYRTTLQAVAMADIVEKIHVTQYILISGGTNSKTMELARQCGLNVSGISVGSYARKIVRDYISQDDFLQNDELFNNALKIAKNLVDKL